MMANKRTSGARLAWMVAVGIAIGTVIGILTDSMGLWLSLGPVFGVLLYAIIEFFRPSVRT